MEPTDDNSGGTGQQADSRTNEAYWRQQAEASQDAVRRLTARVRGRDHRIALLEVAFSRTVIMHHVWAAHLERKLERLRQSDAALHGWESPPEPDRGSGVAVRLPHLTRTLQALFDVMQEYWSEWDPDRPPKSSTVARAIDERLGLKGQANGEASRSAQTFAAALRPDSVNEADGRHR